MKIFGKQTILARVFSGLLGLAIACSPGFALAQNDSEIAGCATSTEADYSDGFLENDFEFTNIGLTDDGNLELLTGQQGINPDKIVVPFEQELFANFIWEGAGYRSDFGWMRYKDAVDANGNFLGWGNIPNDKKHPLFVKVDQEGSNGGFILKNDSQRGGSNRANDTENAIKNWDDGTGNPFLVNNDGKADNRDMRKSLANGKKFAGGEEIVFWLAADTDWRTAAENKMRYSKTAWNPDYDSKKGNNDGNPPGDGPPDEYWISTNPDKFEKVYQLGKPGGESWKIKNGWMTNDAINTLDTFFDISLAEDDEYTLTITRGEPLQHLIVGAPANDPDQWILGWEDLKGGGDTDHNDMVFRIERKTGGTASLKPEEAIVPADANAYYTGVTIDVWDYIPGESSSACKNKTDIRFYVSIDGGENWEEVREWNFVEETNRSGQSLGGGNILDRWVPGAPESTHRTARIDYAAKGMSGRELLWKAEMLSENEACVPEILNVELVGSVANNAIFSRSSPIVQTNMLYSGNYETPAADWPVDERRLRGHLIATRVYDPANPEETNSQRQWDAGEVLSDRTPSDRDIRFNKVDFDKVVNEKVGTGNGAATKFSGTLNHTIVQAGSININDGRETFDERHTNVLVGNRGGTGTLNRFTGEFTVTFKDAPKSGGDITASYTYYSSGTLTDFTPNNLDVDILNLSEEDIVGIGIRDDFTGDGAIDDDDVYWLARWTMGYKDGANAKKAWPLGAIDHSAPAVAVPPGWPAWYPAIEKTALGESYRNYREAKKDRRTAVYVGSRSGMLHAFDGGAFRWDDNPATADIVEHRGYFEWTNSNDSDSADYGTGEEIWAFIPSNLLSRLKNNVHGHGDPAYVDASPAIADVHVNGAWRTVLLAAQGNGGDSVFAMDVTDPYDPQFMWEYIDPDLYRSSSSPAIGQVGRIAIGGEERWASFFISGKTSCSPTDMAANSQFCHPSIFVIDIADGSVIERIYLDAVTGGIGGVPSGQPAIMDFDNNGLIDRMYVGTDKGYMYKVNLPDDGTGSITNCVINTDFTTADGETAVPFQPIHASPTVIKDGGVVKIFFGTADSPYVRGDQSDENYHFFGYVDSDGKGDCGDAELDWFMELPAGHRVFASAFASAGRLYFGTSTADTEDPCEGYGLDEGANEGRLYVLEQDGDFADPELPYVETGDLRAGPTVYDEHVYYHKPASSPDDDFPGGSLGDGIYNNAPVSTGNPETSRSWWREVY
ncbi:MAG: PilC/PilY family type IV pilus protein [Desulfococcaceae bacterium]